MSTQTKTHPAVVTTAPRAPLSILEVPTPTPTGNEVLVKNLWTASTPLDLHQADAGLALPGYPARLGDGVAVRIGYSFSPCLFFFNAPASWRTRQFSFISNIQLSNFYFPGK